ncbi:MAG: SOS response-associated peptidase family protein [Bacteroidota bacterium]
MCGRYGQIEDSIENFARERNYSYEKERLKIYTNYNLSPGNRTSIVLNDEGSSKVTDSGIFQFKYSPHSYKGQINIRIEGKEKNEEKSKAADKNIYDTLNKDNDPAYAGPYMIDQVGSFQKAFREHRCIIPMDYFYEGPEGVAYKKPFLIKRKDDKPFAVAGLYRQFYNDHHYYAGILTTVAPPLLQKVGHHRSPLLLHKEKEQLWLNNVLPTQELIKDMVDQVDTSEFKAYPVDAKMRPPNRKDKPNNSVELTYPIGDAIEE